MHTLDITVIGCGDAFSSGGSLQTCFHVHSQTGDLLIDCGASAYAGLKQKNINLAHIHTIILSHFHGDHYGGVAFLLLDIAIHHPEQALTIVSPRGGKEKIATLLTLLYPATDVLSKIAVQFVSYHAEQELEVNGIKILALPVLHKAESLPHGLRIQLEDKIISYSGDTSWTDQLITLAKDADLFICECNFYSLEVTGHMTYLTLREKLSKLHFKKILLTHLGNEMLANLSKLDLPVASDGMQLTI